MGKGCREGFHLQIVLKTGKNREKKTKNNQKKKQIVWGKDAGKVFIHRVFSKLAKTLRKKQKIIRKKSNSMGKGCREGSHPQIVLKTGKNPEKKTKNNQKKIKQYGERMQGRISPTDCSQNWQKP